MNSAINRLYTELEWKCVNQHAAGSPEVFERWENDPVAYLRESFFFSPMPAQLEPLLNEALAEWKQRQEDFLVKINKNEGEFLNDFLAVRNDFLIESKLSQSTNDDHNQPVAPEPEQRPKYTGLEDLTYTGIVEYEPTQPPKLFPYPYALRGVVSSISEVNLFSWWLPATNAERREELRLVGRLVTAIFYGELISNRRGELLLPEEHVFPKLSETTAILEDRWRMVSKS